MSSIVINRSDMETIVRLAEEAGPAIRNLSTRQREDLAAIVKAVLSDQQKITVKHPDRMQAMKQFLEREAAVHREKSLETPFVSHVEDRLKRIKSITAIVTPTPLEREVDQAVGQCAVSALKDKVLEHTRLLSECKDHLKVFEGMYFHNDPWGVVARPAQVTDALLAKKRQKIEEAITDIVDEAELHMGSKEDKKYFAELRERLKKEFILPKDVAEQAAARIAPYNFYTSQEFLMMAEQLEFLSSLSKVRERDREEMRQGIVADLTKRVALLEPMENALKAAADFHNQRADYYKKLLAKYS